MDPDPIIECLRNEIFFFSVDFSMDFLESEEIIFNPWIEYPWIAVYFINPWKILLFNSYKYKFGELHHPLQIIYHNKLFLTLSFSIL